MIRVIHDHLLPVCRYLILVFVGERPCTHQIRVKDLLWVLNDSSIAPLWMVVTTRSVHVTVLLLAGIDFVEKRVIKLLFPPMSPRAETLKGAPLMIVSYECATLPVLTKLARIIIEQVRLAPEVLPVVRVFALGLVVVVGKIWAPFGLKVVHVEFVILRILVNKACLQIEL